MCLWCLVKKARKPTAHFQLDQDNLDAKEILRFCIHVVALARL